MEEITKLRIFTIVGTIIGTIGMILLLIGSGYRRYTGYLEGGNTVIGGIGLILMVIGGALISYRIKKRK